MDYKGKIRISPLFFLFMAVTSASVQAQESVSSVKESAALIMSLTDEYEASWLFDKLSELEERPAAINSGEEDEIARLFFLTEFQVRVLADYIRKKEMSFHYMRLHSCQLLTASLQCLWLRMSALSLQTERAFLLPAEQRSS